MEGTLASLEAWPLAAALRSGRWSYALVNAAHILGIALLVGAVLPLNLRLAGLFRNIDRGSITRLLVPAAALGLIIAALFGLALFSVRATEYAALPVLWIKLGLVGAGTASAVSLHLSHGLWLDAAPPRRLRLHGTISALCWLGALVCGRLIAFVE